MTNSNKPNKQNMDQTRPWNAVIIEDNQIDAFVCKRLLETAGIVSAVQWITSVDDALEYLKNPDHKPDIIFVDLQIPVKDGLYFLEKYNKERNREDMPIVIVLTSFINKQIVDKIKHYKSVFKVMEKPLNHQVIAELYQELTSPTLTLA